MDKDYYLKKVQESVDVEFKEFQDCQLKRTKEEIFNNNYEIRFYDEIKDYLIESAEIYLNEDHIRCLYEDRNLIINKLYKHYLFSDTASIATPSEITEMIIHYNHTHHRSLLESVNEM